MKPGFTSILASSALALGISQATAATAIGEYATFSGFGTTAVTVTDTDDAEFVRYGQTDGATEDWDYNVDSNLGLQLNVRPNRWLSGTVQAVTRQREEENMDTEIEWAFLAVEPVEGLRIRAGRTALPTFAISDTEHVGYANNWVRPPQEVYGLALLERLEGADVSYRFPVGSTALTLTAFGGESQVDKFPGYEIDVEDMWGGSIQWDVDWASVRVSRVQGDGVLPDVLALIGRAEKARYEFTNVAVSAERDRFVGRAEWAKRETDVFERETDASGWYVFGGYRIGAFLPYAIYASTEPEHDGDIVGQLSGEQSTFSAGVRWDAFTSGALKLQLDRVDADDSHGISFVTGVSPVGVPLPAPGSVNVATLAVDFVF